MRKNEDVTIYRAAKKLIPTLTQVYHVLCDINERGPDLQPVWNQYMNYRKPAVEEFCSG